MLKYFLIFTALGALISKVPTSGVAFFYIGVISLFWWGQTEFIWGLAALGELTLGYSIGKLVFRKSDAHTSMTAMRFENMGREQVMAAKPSAGRRAMNHLETPEELLDRSRALSLQSSAMVILKEEFNYPTGLTKHHPEYLNRVVNEGISLGINEYDAAIASMLLELNNLGRPIPKVHTDFFHESLRRCYKLSAKSNGGHELIRLFVHDRRVDFADDILSRPDMSFLVELLEETDSEFPGHQ